MFYHKPTYQPLKKPVALLLPVLLLLFACRKEQDTEVTVDFEYVVLNDQHQVPVQISFTNKTTGANQYKWTFEGGNPATYDQRNPGTIIFNQAGNIKVTLEAWNNEQRKTKEIFILLDTPLKAKYEPVVVANPISPAEFNFNNTSTGATRFNWTFENGTPATSTDRSPQRVKFTGAGTHKVFLEVFNDRNKKDTLTKFVTVLPPLSADFAITPSFDDDDYEAPLTAKLDNHSISVINHRWETTGGVINNASDTLPTITFNDPGTYTITYRAGNGKDTATIIKTITVLPNTHLRKFTDIKIGINTASNTLGAFFSTRLRKVFKQSELSSTNGPLIDVVFFGLSNSFIFNKFISPDSSQSWTFPAIPGATHSVFVNLQEACGCNTPAYSATDFDNLINGTALGSLNIPENDLSATEFSNSLVPRVVLFRNAAGKKGVIKIKQFVNDGQQSYLLCDIKVQKD